jgi:ATP-binding cassette subfamily F protein 2
MDKKADLEPLSARDKKAEKEAKKREAAEKRAAKKAAKEGGAPEDPKLTAADISLSDIVDVSDGQSAAKLTKEQQRVASNRAVTGVLASTAFARDVKFDAFSVAVGGRQLVSDCHLELTQGCRYGLLGDNGSGKSNVLAAIAQREVPLPKHISCYHLHEEAPPTEMSGVQAVINHVVEEVARLEAMSEAIIEECGPEDERLEAINDRLSELDPVGAEPRARKILAGLGFADHLIPMDRQTKHMSGGWRMRVSLAQALFAAPEVLLLDEPTNHLDLEACVWLEDHLASYPKCLLVVSHSQDFLNAVCTHTVWLQHGTLRYYGGNYSNFVTTVAEEERLQLKVYEKQQADMQKLEDFVRVNMANGVASSAKSKKKVLEKLEDDAVAKPKLREPSLVFKFPECSRLAPPVLPFDNVSFSYSGKSEDYLYTELDLAVDCDSRIALVGPNGCGKSTLLKLMSGELSPSEGSVKKHQHCALGLYHQHSTDVLELDMSPFAFLKKTFPPAVVKKTDEWWRGYLALFGFSTEQQMTPMGFLSDGQRSRVAFAILAMKDHTLLLLDEPTNHLDVDAVDGLASAIKGFGGGVVLVSHDFRLIDQVANEIWVCEDKTVRKYKGTIHEYKKELAKKMAKHKV